MKTFLVDVLMTGSSVGENSGCFVAPGEYPSPTSGYFILDALDNRLVVGFLGGIILVIEINPLGPTYRETLDKNVYMK
jgi:hypothetical protein